MLQNRLKRQAKKSAAELIHRVSALHADGTVGSDQMPDVLVLTA